ncbi:hypothetical protein DFJ73DRAFT_295384 [Zopfochytrium polystomum]|nr:hypothetical protein DFJ73DRAFT_295384 [Zopfochytrium polystomum]
MKSFRFGLCFRKGIIRNILDQSKKLQMRFSSNYWSKFSFPSIFHRSTARAGTNPDLGTLTKVSNVTRGNLQAEDCKITETFHLANSSGHPSASSKSCNGTVEPRSLTFDQLVTAQSPQWIRVDAVTGLATLSHFLQLSMASFASGGLLKVNQQDVLTSKLLGGEGGTLFSFCPSPRGSSFFSLISNDSKLFSNGRCERWSFICLCHWPADLDEKSPHLKNPNAGSQDWAIPLFLHYFCEHCPSCTCARLCELRATAGGLRKSHSSVPSQTASIIWKLRRSNVRRCPSPTPRAFAATDCSNRPSQEMSNDTKLIGTFVPFLRIVGLARRPIAAIWTCTALRGC